MVHVSLDKETSVSKEKITFWSEGWEKECNDKLYESEGTSEQREEEFKECLNKSSHWPSNKYKSGDITTPSPKSKINNKDDMVKGNQIAGNSMQSRSIKSEGRQIKKNAKADTADFPDMEAVRESRGSGHGHEYDVDESNQDPFDYHNYDADVENTIPKTTNDYDIEDKLNFVHDELSKWQGDSQGTIESILPELQQRQPDLEAPTKSISRLRSKATTKKSSKVTLKSNETSSGTTSSGTPPITLDGDGIETTTNEVSTTTSYVPGEGR